MRSFLARVRLVVPDAGSSLARRLRAAIAVASIGLLSLFAVVSPVSADGGDETDEGYLLVQQALGHLAHDASSGGVALAMEKVEDALATTDQEGVAVGDVERAAQALDAGRVGRARALLQGSITQALGELGPATGEQTGTTLVTPSLPGREALTGRDWGFLTASVVVFLAGLWLAVLFRPRDTIGELRQRLGVPGSDRDGGAGSPTGIPRGL